MSDALSRRDFLGLAGLVSVGAVPACAEPGDHADAGERDHHDAGSPSPQRDAGMGSPYDFSHGIASGDPLTDRVILWTRVTPAEALLEVSEVVVAWELRLDAASAQPVARGTVVTSAASDFIVKIDVDGLSASTAYFYRFFDPSRPEVHTEVGRTRTLPAGSPTHARFAAITCTAYSAGYFNSYAHLAERSDLDFVLHLGDYIYEFGDDIYNDESLNRAPDPPHALLTLADYRTRYAQYRSDSDLQAAHAAHPFIVIWDDHEIVSETWNAGASRHDPLTDGDFNERRAAAIQAYLEWMPVRETKRGDRVSLYRRVPLGGLADLIVLDTRLEDRDEPSEASLQDPKSTLIGAAQEQWLRDELESSVASQTAWRLIASPVVMAQLDVPGYVLNLGGWDGYPAVRARVLEYVRDQAIRDVVVLSGDMHAAMASELSKDPFDPGAYDAEAGAGVIAPEITITSATSPAVRPFVNNDGPAVVARTHKHVRFLDVGMRGYVVVELDEQGLTASVLVSDDVKERNAAHETRVTFRVERGSPRLQVASR